MVILETFLCRLGDVFTSSEWSSFCYGYLGLKTSWCGLERRRHEDVMRTSSIPAMETFLPRPGDVLRTFRLHGISGVLVVFILLGYQGLKMSWFGLEGRRHGDVFIPTYMDVLGTSWARLGT